MILRIHHGFEVVWGNQKKSKFVDKWQDLFAFKICILYDFDAWNDETEWVREKERNVKGKST